MLETRLLAFAMPVSICLGHECVCVCDFRYMGVSWAILCHGKCMFSWGQRGRYWTHRFLLTGVGVVGMWLHPLQGGYFILNPASLQWTHMFLLIEDQGAQGYELFFKTRELKKKWMEQFEMAM